MKHVGAQNPAYLIDPSEEVFDQWQEAAGGRIVKSAMAAERDGAAAYAAALNAKGVVTSIGHSDAPMMSASPPSTPVPAALRIPITASADCITASPVSWVLPCPRPRPTPRSSVTAST